jgi:hypothetical protein
MKFNALSALLVSLIVPAVMAAEPIGHWTLDDKEGDTVTDISSGKNNGKAKNIASRVEGKVGGAFTFNGKDSHVEIPNSKELDTVQNGSFTLCAWFKAEDAPAGTDDANNAQYAILVKTGWHMGLHYGNDKKFAFAYFLKGDTDAVWNGIGTWDTEYEPGAWHHVVGVIEKDNRVAKIYVDGELKGTSTEWDTAAVARDYGNETWKIGTGRPGAEKWGWSAKAAIDDVRIYNVALKEEEVKALYDSGSKGK